MQSGYCGSLDKIYNFLAYEKDKFDDKLVKLYVNEVVRLHGVPISIISY